MLTTYYAQSKTHPYILCLKTIPFFPLKNVIHHHSFMIDLFLSKWPNTLFFQVIVFSPLSLPSFHLLVIISFVISLCLPRFPLPLLAVFCLACTQLVQQNVFFSLFSFISLLLQLCCWCFPLSIFLELVHEPWTCIQKIEQQCHIREWFFLLV